MKYKIINSLIEKAEEFYSAHEREPHDVEELLQWLTERSTTMSHSLHIADAMYTEANTAVLAAAHKPNRQSGTQPLDSTQGGLSNDTIESAIARHVSLLYRYAKHYIKKVLENSPLTSVDDFSYLAPLCFQSHLTKSELIAINIHEKTTGTEIIKRLIQRELIEEMPNPADGRSKILQITEKGRYVFFSIVQPMLTASEIIGGNLTMPEKETLLLLLAKLHRFHEPLFRDHREIPLDELNALVRDSASRQEE
jgi:MarR family transcriptional regulator, lower aerobic nicotinate degradation pathway regulator